MGKGTMHRTQNARQEDPPNLGPQVFFRDTVECTPNSLALNMSSGRMSSRERNSHADNPTGRRE
jgi:hypothetical protein